MRPGRGAITTTRVPDGLEQLLHVHARLRIQRAKGLVHEQHRRVHRERAGQAGTHLHPAGELVGQRVLEAVELHAADELTGTRLALRTRHSPGRQGELQVAQHRHPREERGLLEHEQPVGPRPADALAVDGHGAAGGLHVAGQRVQQRGLAAARGPQQADELARADVEVHILERHHFVRVSVAQLRHGDLRALRMNLRRLEQAQ
jgi:hypothetical protein